MAEQTTPKQLTGYCEPLSLRAGESVRLMASAEMPIEATLDLVRIVCGDPSRHGPGFKEVAVPSALPKAVMLARQALVPGSSATASLDGITADSKLELEFHVMPTRPELEQTVVEIESTSRTTMALEIAGGRWQFSLGDSRHTLDMPAVAPRRWYAVRIEVGTDSATVTTQARATRSPALDLAVSTSSASQQLAFGLAGFGAPAGIRFAASAAGARFDGRIARPALTLDGLELRWNLSANMAGRTAPDGGPAARDLTFHQLPSRAVTGPDWDGSTQAWTARPEHYDAVHFHSDDLYDAGWNTTATLDVPTDLPSGIYAFRLSSAAGEDRVPFFVRPARGAPTADIALLMPSCTYMAYANHRMLFEGADFVAARARLRPEHAYIRDHRELGPSCYEKHDDGSGVIFSSRNRPVLQLRPGADGWNFTPDTVLNAFLEHLELGHDILSDEDLHAEGIAALEPYRVLVTGTHPEYWSTAMLDALEAWQRRGGRMLYLGGNGFYWRVAFSPAWPGAIELRRAEDGVRNWQSEPGEYYHAFGGEYGGLWRRLGRPPNMIAGIGFTAQGFEKATYYTRAEGSQNPRAAWIFEGVDGERIGTAGLGGGAAGQEIDRLDPLLGSPPHALVLATADDFAPDMVRVKEEFEGSVFLSPDDPLVRADMVFYETPAGGAVFSVGSIGWFGALARDDYDNDVARITANVLRRFADANPFELPEAS